MDRAFSALAMHGGLLGQGNSWVALWNKRPAGAAQAAVGGMMRGLRSACGEKVTLEKLEYRSGEGCRRSL